MCLVISHTCDPEPLSTCTHMHEQHNEVSRAINKLKKHSEHKVKKEDTNCITQERP